jgi:hypothetical protein
MHKANHTLRRHLRIVLMPKILIGEGLKKDARDVRPNRRWKPLSSLEIPNHLSLMELIFQPVYHPHCCSSRNIACGNYPHGQAPRTIRINI